MKTLYSRYSVALRIYASELFGVKGNRLGWWLVAPSIIAATSFVILLPSWSFFHSAASLPRKTAQVSVDRTEWARPRFKSGINNQKIVIFDIEGQTLQYPASFPVVAGDKIGVAYGVDSGGRVLVQSIEAVRK